MITAKVIADSISRSNARVTTFVCTYPRFVHSEVMTHRVLSRNASSSRAIPIDKMIQAVEENPAMPVFWGKNQSGMQAKEELDNVRKYCLIGYEDEPPKTQREHAIDAWLTARSIAVAQARRLQSLGVHKQLVNRVIEPWSHITVVMTGTDWANFFALRVHPDAQPEFEELAAQMLQAFVDSEPVERKCGEWHLPFISDEERTIYHENMLLKLCTARCARVSYLNHEGQNDPQKDAVLHDKLRESGHMSPFEHACQAMGMPEQVGNFHGWYQYRKQLPRECIMAIDAEALLAARKKS